ncbi:hypothetical protein ACLHDG_09290 [Sulfurovum sp. CS9]|uniref:hypothetical protein n=1 Tax=Sulfurovum sp. CS9 TaxID=3391146 RepID=UPI0039EBB61E
MAQEKPSLETLLGTSEGKRFLFLGREGIFTKEETARFLKKYNITMTTNYEEGVVGVVEHHQLNPVEENISNMVYDAKVPLYKLIDFEKILSEGINDDELLMVIKLSNDQERIFRLLGNQYIADELFVKLLSMYEWHEDEDDHTGDRDVITYVLRRYIDIKPNEEDLLYSYLTLRRLATEASDPKMLMVLIGFPNFSFLVRGKGSVTLRETIARNKYVDKEVITKLISLRDVKVDASLAGNLTVPLNILESFAKKDSLIIDKSLASNRNINDDIFATLLEKDEAVLALLFWWQPLNEKRLTLIEGYNFGHELFATIGANENLSEEVVNSLIQKDDAMLLCNLSSNATVSSKSLETLYKRQVLETYTALASNPNLSVEILQSLYDTFTKELEMMSALASNSATPEPILCELFERDELEINKGLASNETTPLELLDILKIDTRVQNALTKNKVFIEHHQNSRNII